MKAKGVGGRQENSEGKTKIWKVEKKTSEAGRQEKEAIIARKQRVPKTALVTLARVLA